MSELQNFGNRMDLLTKSARCRCGRNKHMQGCPSSMFAKIHHKWNRWVTSKALHPQRSDEAFSGYERHDDDFAQMRMKLASMKTDITETLDETHRYSDINDCMSCSRLYFWIVTEQDFDLRRVMAETSKHLVEYFAKVPGEQLTERIKATYARFDANGDGMLQR